MLYKLFSIFKPDTSDKLFNNPVGIGVNGGASENYPINSGELMMKLVEKMDFKTNFSSTSSSSKQE